MVDKLKMHSVNKVSKNIEAIGKLFPNCVTEKRGENGDVVKAIDFDMLRQELSGVVVEGNEERYQFTWPDKKNSILLANAPISKTLRPCREESVNFNSTENIYIEGDNLDVLKLLQETYLGKIKMIYIDPPYNTGNDFVYEDDFAENVAEYLINSGQIDEEGNRLVQNSERNGRFHTDWLNMLYPRLKLAKNLLSEDGVIFISVDEHEIENCLKVLDEVFGRINREGIIIVKSNPRGSMSIGNIANLHEYLVLYCKNHDEAAIIGHRLSGEMEEEYRFSDERGDFRLLGLRMRGGFWRRSERPNLYFPIYINPSNGSVSVEEKDGFSEVSLPVQPSSGEDGTWRWSKEKILAEKDCLIAKKVRRGNVEVWDVFQKDYYIRQGGRRTKAKSIWDDPEINYQNGSTEIRELFGTNVFDYSKPTFLVSRAMEMIDLEDLDIVMDFFSGSATTAQAVMRYNSVEEKRIRHIMVQLAGETSAKSEAYKVGYKNICEIGKERIRRAGIKIKERNLEKADLDTGFRVLKLDSSNMKDIYYNPSETVQTMMGELADNIKADRSPEDLLFQVMLDLGILLSSKIEESKIAGKKVFNVAEGFLIACFDEGITDEVVTAIAKQKPYYFVMRDSSMASDSVAANFDQIFATYSPATERRVL